MQRLLAVSAAIITFTMAASGVYAQAQVVIDQVQLDYNMLCAAKLPSKARHASFRIVNRSRDAVRATLECSLLGSASNVLENATTTDHWPLTIDIPALSTGLGGGACFADIEDPVQGVRCQVTKIVPIPPQYKDRAHIRSYPTLADDAFGCRAPETLAGLFGIRLQHGLSNPRGVIAMQQWAQSHDCIRLTPRTPVDIKGEPIFWGPPEHQCSSKMPCNQFMLCVGDPCHWVYRDDVEGDLQPAEK
jgi:hypothetical protein